MERLRRTRAAGSGGRSLLDESTIKWADWKQLVRELLKTHNPNDIHPRFLHAQLCLSRINTIHRFTHILSFDPHIRSWHNYDSSLFRDNLSKIAAATVLVALVLTAMQVGLATERLQGNADFQWASYAFTIFAILGPMCALGLVIMGELFNLITDVPGLLWDRTAQPQSASV
ncbi:hypothetical protein FSOLCH5_011706 [Fusarium solani]